MSSPLDKSTLDSSADHMVSDPALGSTTTDERGRFQLSREMKILLGVLALGAAVGGWYVFSGAGTPAADTAGSTPAQTTPATTAQTPVTQTPETQTPETQTPTTQTPGTQVVPGVTASVPSTTTTPPAGSASTGVSSGTGAVDVPQIPPLNPQTSTGSTAQNPDALNPDGTTAPAGINPADPLAAIPSSNPFQPLTVIDNSPASVAAAAVQSDTGTPSGAAAPTAAVSSTPSLNTSGAVPLPNVPLAGISSGGAALGGSQTMGGTSSGLSSGGAIPLPTVPLGGLPATGSTGPGNAGTGNAASGTTGTGDTGTVAAPTPPAAGSITPGLATPTLGSMPLGTVLGTSAQAATGSGAATGTAAAAAALSDSQPGVISQYGSANAPAVASVPVVSALDQLVQGRSLIFNAVVLGPINTAIFKTDKGFVVVPTGQNIPDSSVILKEVTATSATLSLGSDSKILELDKR